MKSIRVKRTYLHLHSPDALRRAHLPPGACIERAHPCPISFFRFLYTEVGRDYRWRDRLSWTDEQCAAHLAWSLGASRVWLHTCTLDDEAALPNYLARGFEKLRELESEIAG